jgi:hypothetical protein
MTLKCTLAEGEILSDLRTNVTDPVGRASNSEWIKYGTMEGRPDTPRIYLHREQGDREETEIGSYNKHFNMLLTLEIHVAKDDVGTIESVEYRGLHLCSALIDHIENIMLSYNNKGSYFKRAEPVLTSGIREWELTWNHDGKPYKKVMYSGLATYKVMIENWD